MLYLLLSTAWIIKCLDSKHFYIPPLCIGITFAIFILFGKVPLEKDLLHIKVNGSEINVRICFTNVILRFMQSVDVLH